MTFLRLKQNNEYSKYEVPTGKPRPNYSGLDMWEHGILMNLFQTSVHTGSGYYYGCIMTGCEVGEWTASFSLRVVRDFWAASRGIYQRFNTTHLKIYISRS